jgi:hypothetical protein
LQQTQELLDIGGSENPRHRRPQLLKFVQLFDSNARLLEGLAPD